MAVPYLLKRAIDAIQRGEPVQRRRPAARRRSSPSRSCRRWRARCSRALIFNVGRDVEYDLRNDLFAHLQRLPRRLLPAQQTGDLMSRLVNDVTAVRMLLGVGVLNLVNTPIYYVYGVAIMLSLDPRADAASRCCRIRSCCSLVKRVSRRSWSRRCACRRGSPS